MKRIDMITEAQNMLEIMQPMILESGLQKGLELGAETEECDKLPIKVVRDGYAWLLGIYMAEYRSVMAIRKLLPEKVWERYKIYNDEDLNNRRESILLRERLAAMKMKLRRTERPDLFIKTSVRRLLRAREKAQKSARPKD